MPNQPPEAPGPPITAQLTGLDYALPGTLARRFMRCGQTNCRCKADPATPHGPYWSGIDLGLVAHWIEFPGSSREA